MKVIYLAPCTSMHAIRWANAMEVRGINIIYITNKGKFIDKLNSKIEVKYLKYPKPFGFFLNKFNLEKIIREVKPDLVHIHQASGYGLLAGLCSFKEKLTSIYGFEVYRTPIKSIFHKEVIGFILKKSTYLASTSYDMRRQTYTMYPKLKKDIFITPFGIDTEKFYKNKKNINSRIVIGIIKKLEKVYGIEYLIEAIEKLYYGYNYKNIELKIVGKGSLKSELIEKVKLCKLEGIVEFIDRIPHAEVPKMLNRFDIYCAPSLSESFGVAIIEASSCELPVVVSDVGGLPEVVDDNLTGYVVKRKNSEELSKKLYELCISKELRENLGKKGRKKVLKEYNWNENVESMIEIYKEIREKN